MNSNTEGLPWFSILAGVPAIMAWAAYGVAWLLGPHFAVAPDPLVWAGYAAGGYYALVLSFVSLMFWGN